MVTSNPGPSTTICRVMLARQELPTQSTVECAALKQLIVTYICNRDWAGMVSVEEFPDKSIEDIQKTVPGPIMALPLSIGSLLQHVHLSSAVVGYCMSR